MELELVKLKNEELASMVETLNPLTITGKSYFEKHRIDLKFFKVIYTTSLKPVIDNKIFNAYAHNENDEQQQYMVCISRIPRILLNLPKTIYVEKIEILNAFKLTPIPSDDIFLQEVNILGHILYIDKRIEGLYHYMITKNGVVATRMEN